ncbi:MAG: hypothetical protein AAFR61_21605 [Bacteroidota bacterium]
MDKFSQSEHSHLRAVEVMLAYLKDEASPEDREEIEFLMETDELYRLAMEQLSRSVVRQPSQVEARVLAMEAAMPEKLQAAKERFVRELAKQETPPVSGNTSRNLPPWAMYLGIGIGILLFGWAVWFSTSDHTSGLKHLAEAAQTQLTPDGEIATANLIMNTCGEEDPGIGRVEQVSIYSAMVENYAEDKFEKAARQFGQLLSDPGLETSCKSLIRYYRAKSLMAIGEHDQARMAFTDALQQGNLPEQVKNACHWYLGNLYLLAENFVEAKEQFSVLSAQLPVQEGSHLSALLAKDYLQLAQEYTQEIDRH